MRHLINTYVQADPAADLGNLSSLSLTELIIETGIHDAIARKLNAKGKLSKNAIAEGSSTTSARRSSATSSPTQDSTRRCRSCLTTSSSNSATDAAAYEEFLKKAEELVKRLAEKKRPAAVLQSLHGKSEAIVLFNNLASIPATTFQCPADEEEQGEARTRTRPRHAREGPGGLEGRRHAREASAQRAVPASCRGTARRHRPFSRSSRISRGY